MDYLVYIEHNAENLQFYLWYKDYVRRFGTLSGNEKKLSPVFNVDVSESLNTLQEGEMTTNFKRKKGSFVVRKGSGSNPTKPSLFGDDGMSRRHDRSISMVRDDGSTLEPSMADSFTPFSNVAEGNHAALAWQPCENHDP